MVEHLASQKAVSMVDEWVAKLDAYLENLKAGKKENC